jgi:VCBS repeat-containing protein
MGHRVQRFASAGFMALEPRIMFDAAAGDFAERALLHHIDGAADATAGDHQTDALIDGLRTNTTAPTIIFVDDKVENFDALIAEFGPDAEIHLLNSNRDGVAQIADALQGRHDIGAIHIVSHGAAGELELGSSQLTADSIKGTHAHDLAVIGAALSTDADILVYGCDFAAGERGSAAVAALASATGADIAASTNITGAAEFGGDWILERHAGEITAGSLKAWHWFSTLAKSVINSSGGLNANGSDGMAIHVIDNGQLQIVYNLNGSAAGNYQLYHPGTNTESAALFNGVYLAMGNQVTGSSHYADGTARNANWGKGGQTVSGTGSSTDPYIVTTTLFSATDGNAVYNPATDAQVVIRTIYTMPNAYFTEEVTVTPPTGNTSVLKYYHTLDTFLAGGDNGPAFSLPQNLAQTNNTTGNPSVVGVRKDPGGANDSFVAFAEVQGGREFDHWYSGYYSGGNLYGTVGGGIKSGGNIVNTWNTDPQNDNGLGVQFTLGAITQATTFSYNIAFGGEATLDLDANDSSGATGSAFNAYYVQGSSATIPIVDSDVAIHNVVGDITRVRATLSNGLSGDALAVNASHLPAGIHVVSQSGNEIVLGAVSTPQTEEQFQLAMRTLGFTTSNTSLASRTINFAVTNELGQEGLASAGTIVMNRAPAIVADDGGSIVFNDPSAHTGNVLGNDSDPDVTNVLRVDSVASSSGAAVTVAPTGTTVAGQYGTLTLHRDGSYSYALDPDNATVQAMAAGSSLTESFTYTAIDVVNSGGTDIAQGGSGTVQLSFSIDRPMPHPPVTHDDVGSVTEDQTLTVSAANGLLANDTDADGDTLAVTSFTIDNSAAHAAGSSVVIADVGTITINADGSYQFVPVANYDGSIPDIEYTVSDGTGHSGTAVLQLDMQPVNDAPELERVIPDVSSVDGATPAIININDYVSDVDNGSLAFSASGLPPGLTLNPATGIISGVLLHDASQGGVAGDGVYDVTVTISDGTNPPVTTLIHYAITNPPPDASDDQADVTEDSTLSVPATSGLLANDSDSDGDQLIVTNYTVEGFGTHAAGSMVTITDVGELTINEDGSYSFVPVPDYSGTIPAITYSISDSEGGVATAALDLYFSPVTDPPEAIDDNVTGVEDHTITGSVLANDTDADGDELAVTSFTIDTSAPHAAGSHVVIANVGTLTVGSDGAYEFVPLPNYAGPIPAIEYTVEDGTGNSATAVLQLSLTPVDDGPSVTHAIPRVSSVDGETPTVLDLNNYVQDPEGDPLTFTASGLPPGLTLNPATGIISGTLQHDASQGGIAGDGVYDVTVAVSDGVHAPATTVIHYAITNPAPAAGPDQAEVMEDTTLIMPATVGLLANDTDPDGDPLRVAHFNIHGVGQVAAGTSALIPGVGVLTVNADGSYAFAPRANYKGPIPRITYTTTDDEGGSDTAELALSFAGANDVPVGVDDHITGDEDHAIRGNVLANDLDADGDVLHVSAVGNGLPGHAVNLPYGALTVNRDGSYSLVPNARANALREGQTVTQSVVYTLSDDSGALATAELTLTIVGVNDLPLGKPLPDQHHTVGDVIAITTKQAFSDVDGDTLTYSTTGLPPGLAIDPYTGLIKGTLLPSVAEHGPYQVSVTSDDGHGGKATVTFTVEVGSPGGGVFSSHYVPEQLETPDTTISFGKPVLGVALGGLQDLNSSSFENGANAVEKTAGQIARSSRHGWSRDAADRAQGLDRTHVYGGDIAHLASLDHEKQMVTVSTVLQDGAIYVGLEKLIKDVDVVSVTPVSAASAGRMATIDRQHFVINAQPGVQLFVVKIMCRTANGELQAWTVGIEPSTGRVVRIVSTEAQEAKVAEPFTSQIATLLRRNNAQQAQLLQALAGR